MPALISVWIALLTLLLSVTMLLYRPAFTDLAVILVLWFGAPGAMCLGGLALWAYRKEGQSDAGVVAQRLQAKIAIGMAIVAAGIVYALIIGSQKIEPIDAGIVRRYNAAPGMGDRGTDFPVGRMTSCRLP